MKFRFKNFRVYQEAKDYCKYCRDVIERYVEKKDKGLTNQLERALHSIVLNIAEGSADNSDPEFARFLSISIRSVYETVAGFDLAFSRFVMSDFLKFECCLRKLLTSLSKDS